MHSIVNDKSKKVLVATLSGNIGVDQANQMLNDFRHAINGLKTEEYVLIINPESLNASLFVIPILQNFIKLVGTSNFKTIYLINSDKYSGYIKQMLGNTEVAARLKYAASTKQALSSL